MTIDEITQMNSGRDLDALVAEKVLGKKPCRYVVTGIISTLTMWQCAHQSPENCYPEDLGPCLESYSSDIGCAWKIVEKLREKFFVEIGEARDPLPGDPSQARVCLRSSNNDARTYVYAETTPLAICRAALKVVGA